MVKGGRRFGFSALVVVRDSAGVVGVGLGKASEVRKRFARASSARAGPDQDSAGRRATLPRRGISGAGRVLMQPASQGTGVIAGGPVRAVVESAGVSDVLTKTLGTKTPRNVVNAVMAGLSVRDPDERLAQLGRTRWAEGHVMADKTVKIQQVKGEMGTTQAARDPRARPRKMPGE